MPSSRYSSLRFAKVSRPAPYFSINPCGIILKPVPLDVGMASASANSPRLQADMHRRTIQGCIAHGQVHVGVVNGRIQGVVAATSPGADWHF